MIFTPVFTPVRRSKGKVVSGGEYTKWQVSVEPGIIRIINIETGKQTTFRKGDEAGFYQSGSKVLSIGKITSIGQINIGMTTQMKMSVSRSIFEFCRVNADGFDAEAEREKKIQLLKDLNGTIP